jgi:hypothetical protein
MPILWGPERRFSPGVGLSGFAGRQGLVEASVMICSYLGVIWHVFFCDGELCGQ